MGDIHLRKLVELKNLEFEIAEAERTGNGSPVRETAKANSGTKSIHVFKGHSRRVTSVTPVSSKSTYFLSASLDGKLRIWCIEKMIELYCFDVTIDSPVCNSAMSEAI